MAQAHPELQDCVTLICKLDVKNEVTIMATLGRVTLQWGFTCALAVLHRSTNSRKGECAGEALFLLGIL